MVTNFEEYTTELNEYERTKLLPIVASFFRIHIGRDNPIKNAEIREVLAEHGHEVSAITIRKIINVIRRNAIIPFLVSSSKGYYVAETVAQISGCIDSLQGREEAIRAVKEALMNQREEMREQMKKRQPDS